MFKRAVASSLFLAGGLVTWVALSLLKGFAASQAGMSAGRVPDVPGSEAVALWLFCSYFLVSAVSAIATGKKQVLWGLFAFAHAMVAIAFCALCSEGFGEDGGKLASGVLTLLLITGVFFSPWLAVWAWLLMKARPNTTEAIAATPGNRQE